MNHNLQSNIFYKKYIKYKKKYLDLKNSEFFGGNLNSAKKYFNKFLQQEKNKKKFELIVKDLNEKLNIDTQDPDEIFLKIVEGTNDKNVYDFVRMYLSSFKKNSTEKKSKIDLQIEQLNISRTTEGPVILNKDNVEILGSFKEPDNVERLLVLVKLNTPYIDLLGNIKYKLPFYMSSGKYSLDKKGTFHPFFGLFTINTDKNNINNILLHLEKKLKIPSEQALSKDRVYKYFLKNHEPNETSYKLFTIPNFMKCSYIHVIKNLFESEQLKRIINNQTIFKNDYSRMRGKNTKLCNEYLDKYSDALSTYFDKNRINIDYLKNVTNNQINELISINSIFGLNINIIPNTDINYPDVIEKINYYYSRFSDLIENGGFDYVTTNEESIKKIFNYFSDPKILPTYEDLLRFYNSYHNLEDKDHEYIVDLIKDFYNNEGISWPGEETQKKTVATVSTGVDSDIALLLEALRQSKKD